MASQYLIGNGPMPTTAGFAAVTTGTAIKTMLQLKPFNACKLIAWRVDTDAPASTEAIKCELLDTGTVFGTVTASADADCSKFGGVADQSVASVVGLTLGTSATGYTCTSEGSITSTRIFDMGFANVGANGGATYSYQWPLGREPFCAIGNAVRIRLTASVACNALCYLVVEF